MSSKTMVFLNSKAGQLMNVDDAALNTIVQQHLSGRASNMDSLAVIFCLGFKSRN